MNQSHSTDVPYLLGQITAKLEAIASELSSLKKELKAQDELVETLRTDLRNLTYGSRLFITFIFGLGAFVAWLIDFINGIAPNITAILGKH